MIAVITGDIINSRKVSTEIWISQLKEFLSKTLKQKDQWEIFRGDSFQIEIEVENALHLAMCIKALIKSNNTIDVRMAIGIGEKEYQGSKVIESNGSAFVHSGESFEILKNDTFIIKTPFAEFDDYFNPILKLLGFISSNWKPITAETIFYALTHPHLLQKEMAENLSKDKTTINKALKRGGFDEFQEVFNLYTKKVERCLNSF